MSNGIVLTLSYFITPSEASFFHSTDLLVVLFKLQSSFLLLNANANGMPLKTEKSKVLHFYGLLKCTDDKK